MKAACFVGTAREDLAVFPESARRRAGYELYMVQLGREPADFKPIPMVGLVAKFQYAVYVLHAFQKKTRKTSQADIELAARRYQVIGEER
jgi:phage-related protein